MKSVLRCRIARTVTPNWRGGRHAQFEREDGFYLCDAWFEDGEPRMQIRSGAHGLEEAAQVHAAIHMAIEWAVGELVSPPQNATKPATEIVDVSVTNRK